MTKNTKIEIENEIKKLIKQLKKYPDGKIRLRRNMVNTLITMMMTHMKTLQKGKL